MKISGLKVGINEIIFLNNILENGDYGERFITKKGFYLKNKNKFIFDDKKNPLFDKLNKLYFKNDEIRKYFSAFTKTFTYCMLNGEYTLLTYGRSLNDLLKILKDFNPDKQKILVYTSLTDYRFLKIDNIYAIKSDHQFNDEFLKKNKIYADKYFDNLKWNSKRNYNDVYNAFKELGLEKTITQLKNEQRKLKINKLFKENDI